MQAILDRPAMHRPVVRNIFQADEPDQRMASATLDWFERSPAREWNCVLAHSSVQSANTEATEAV
jgi:hypothetical protein